MTQKVLAKLMSFASSDKLGLFKIAIASSCLMIVPQGQVRAASIFIANHSFESPPITDPSGFTTISSGTSNNWTFAGGSVQGFLNPGIAETATPGDHFYGTSPTLPNGNQVAWSNGGTISQTLSATLQANTKYTLGAFVGRRFGESFPGYNIQLLAGTTVLASSGSSVTPTAGTFAPVTVSYTSGSSGSLIGQALKISLTSSSGSQTNFDLITLDASPIPEPSAMLGLLGFGLLGIASTLKQKR